MDEPYDNRAWFLVLPVLAIVAFSAVIPLMTVVNYSVQDTFGNNQFFWNGTGWFKELLDPSSDLGGRVSSTRSGATSPSPRSSWRSRCRSASRSRSPCRARAGRSRRRWC